MYWYLFIGVLGLYLCIVYPIILLGAAVLIGINLFLQRAGKRTVEEANEEAVEAAEKSSADDALSHIKTSDDLNVGSDVIDDASNHVKTSEYSHDLNDVGNVVSEEKLSKFTAGFTHRPNPDDPESTDECEFVVKDNGALEFLKPDEMPSNDHWKPSNRRYLKLF